LAIANVDTNKTARQIRHRLSQQSQNRQGAWRRNFAVALISVGISFVRRT